MRFNDEHTMKYCEDALVNKLICSDVLYKIREDIVSWCAPYTYYNHKVIDKKEVLDIIDKYISSEDKRRRELLQEDLKDAYLYILAVKEYNQNDYGRGDLITKARQYLHLEV